MHVGSSTLPVEEKLYFSQVIKDGPSDPEMRIVSHPVKLSNINIFSLWTQEFDSVSTFAIARSTANMWRSTLESLSVTFRSDQYLTKAVSY